MLDYAKSEGLIVTEELVGEEEVVIIDREDNQNSQWFDGAQMAAVAPTEGLVESYVGHYNIRTFMQLTDTEKLENAGEAQNISRLKIRMRAMERSFKKTLSQALAGTRGTNYMRPEALRDLMGGAAPSSSCSTLQGLSISGRTWWAPTIKSITALGPNNSAIKTMLTELFLEGSKIYAKPSLGICDQNFYLHYLKSLGGGAEVPGYGPVNVRTSSLDRPAAKLDLAGPPEIAWQGVPIRFDADVSVPSTDYTGTSAGHCNFVDLEMYEIVVDPRWNFKLYQPRPRSGNDLQWVDVYALVLRLTTRCYNRRRQLLAVLNV
jgi:hypothetical protein